MCRAFFLSFGSFVFWHNINNRRAEESCNKCDLLHIITGQGIHFKVWDQHPRPTRILKTWEAARFRQQYFHEYEQQRCRPDCASAQSGPHLCCSDKPNKDFLTSRLLYWVRECFPANNNKTNLYLSQHTPLNLALIITLSFDWYITKLHNKAKPNP